MPGLHKIGYSTKDPKLRAEELNHTGSPHPYVVEYELLIEEPFQIEQQVHKILKDNHEGKEWFRGPIEDAIVAIKKIVGNKYIIYEKTISNLPNDKKPDSDSSKPRTPEEIVIPSVVHYKVRGVKTKCSNCGTPYSVTLRRYETNSTCPRCFTYHPVDVDWN